MLVHRRSSRHFIALLCLSAPGIAAACSTWDVTGTRQIEQGNGITVYANFHQNGSSVTGTAAWTEIRRQNGEKVGVGHDGGVQGSVNGGNFEVVITWNNGSTGVYSGQIAQDGRVSGVNYDRRTPGTRVAWHATQALRCADAPKKVVGLGKRKPAKPLDPVVAQTRVVPLPDSGFANSPSAPIPAPAAAGVQREPPATCRSGYVWRVARSSDLVCVEPASRELAADENRSAPERWNPGGAYGPATCVSGFVWREAFEGDTVCVVPQRRDAVREENRLGASRRAGS